MKNLLIFLFLSTVALTCTPTEITASSAPGTVYTPLQAEDTAFSKVQI